MTNDHCDDLYNNLKDLKTISTLEFFNELLKNRVTGNIEQETHEKILNANRKMIIERYGERGLINIEKMRPYQNRS